MATSSIFHQFHIKDRKAANKFVDALLYSIRRSNIIADSAPQIKVRELSLNEIQELLDQDAIRS